MEEKHTVIPCQKGGSVRYLASIPLLCSNVNPVTCYWVARPVPNSVMLDLIRHPGFLRYPYSGFRLKGRNDELFSGNLYFNSPEGPVFQSSPIAVRNEPRNHKRWNLQIRNRLRLVFLAKMQGRL